MFKLNEKTKKNIQKHVGIPFESIITMNFKEIEHAIQKKKDKKIKFDSTVDKRLIGRGSVYLFLSRIMGMDKIDKKLSNI
ncbi:MAG: hypothetical protein WA118_03540 [Carboxydocellales bacterium]